MDGYDKLTLIEKIKFKYRVWQEERLEDKRQDIEHDDHIPVNRQKIVDELLAERAKKENKKNNVKFLSASKDKPIQKLPNTIKQYKVPSDTIKSPVEMALEQEEKRLEQMLRKELNSEKDAYDNIVELQTFLNYPHDNIPDVENRINEKLFYIQNILGKDVLDKGMQIYENDKALKEMYNTISIVDTVRLKEKILNNPILSKQLNDLRYNPEKSKKSTGRIVLYQAVFSKMIEEENNPMIQNKNENENELDDIA